MKNNVSKTDLELLSLEKLRNLCRKIYDDICSMEDISSPDTLFIRSALVPMIDMCIEDINQRSNAFVSEVAQKMIIRIFEDINMEILQEYSTSDTTILAAKNLLHIALEDEGYKCELEKTLTFCCDYGYLPVSCGV